LEKKIKKNQTDKDGNLIILYAQNKDDQHSYIKNAKEKGYEVLLLDSPIISHLMQKFESKKEKKESTEPQSVEESVEENVEEEKDFADVDFEDDDQ
jgi:molecular chaperone HtpG